MIISMNRVGGFHGIYNVMTQPDVNATSYMDMIHPVYSKEFSPIGTLNCTIFLSFPHCQAC
jgi:hypothetical protein